jgi:U3 small nucleolar RNA-associated protein 20
MRTYLSARVWNGAMVATMGRKTLFPPKEGHLLRRNGDVPIWRGLMAYAERWKGAMMRGDRGGAWKNSRRFVHLPREKFHTRRDTIFVQAQLSSTRLDVENYEIQLLELLARIPQLAQKHGRDVIPLFFEHFENVDSDEQWSAGGRRGRARLSAWMKTFSKLSNPKALYRADDLRSFYLRLLSIGDTTIQRLAVDCLLTWKDPYLLSHRDRLADLLDEVKFRDTLLRFSLAPSSEIIAPAERADLLPVITRLLYGLVTTRHRRQAARKTATLASLRSCTTPDLDLFVGLMLAPFQSLLPDEGVSQFVLPSTPGSLPSKKRQVGFLTLLGDVIKHLGANVRHCSANLLAVTLSLVHFAALDDKENQTSARQIRLLGTKRLSEFSLFLTFEELEFILPAMFTSLISPKLSALPSETTQSPSALLQLLVAWSSKRDVVPALVKYDSSVLPAVFACLAVPKVKSTVVLRILDLVQNLLGFAEAEGKDSFVVLSVVRPHVASLLANLSVLLERTVSSFDARNEVSRRQLNLLLKLVPYVDQKEEASGLVTILLPLLRRPRKVVPEGVQINLLAIIADLIPLGLDSPTAPNAVRLYETLSILFSALRSRNGRLGLVRALQQFSAVDDTCSRVASLLEDLNAFSVKRSEEPDFDRRLLAFSQLNETAYKTMSSREWLPLVYNMLAFVQDPDELSIRSSASFALRRFVEAAALSDDSNMRGMLCTALLPAMQACLRSRTEFVRSEILSVFATAAELCSQIPEFSGMASLLVSGDEEANFFNNIHHVQIHRRTRALRRLADNAEAGNITSKQLTGIFLPLVGHFVTGSTDAKDPQLANEAIQCIGRLASRLPWSAYNSLLQNYLRLGISTGPLQKVYIRTVVAILKAFSYDLSSPAALAAPSSSHILSALRSRLLPRLMGFIEKREDSDEGVRVPLAEGVAKMLQHLPEDVRKGAIQNLLMVLSQILRSKSQDTRDLARNAICNIALSLGPDYFPMVVKELRVTLARGPQLHVLAFTVHALLLRVVESQTPFDVDEALGDIVPVIADDIFGQPARDRESQEFRAKSKFREVRACKSLDSFQMVARIVSPERIARVLAPIRDVLQRTESLKAMQNVEDVFGRLTQGVQTNQHFDVLTLLGLCQSLISRNADFLRPRKAKTKTSFARSDYKVELSRPDKREVDYYAKNAFRFEGFGLDLLNASFRRNRFDLHDPSVVSRLDPLVALVGNALYAADAQVLIRGLRAVASLIRCPLASIDEAAPLLLRRSLVIVDQAGGVDSEVAQVAIRTLSAIIRDCKTATLSDKELVHLFRLIAPDLEDHERQHTLFTLLRAIVSRKFVAPEIYELMDRVAEILVTNQSSQIREICRSVYLQFLLDYPQGKGRLKNSLAFLTKNLSYEHESGRTSVLEIVSAIFTKFSPKVLEPSFDLFFLSLVMVVANDQSSKCREMAAEVIKTLFKRVEGDGRTRALDMLCAWARQDDKPQLKRTASQLLGVTFEAMGESLRSLSPTIASTLFDVVQRSAGELREAEEDGDGIEGDKLDWQLPYQALQSLAKAFRAFEDLIRQGDDSAWSSVRTLLLHPHVWVRAASARLIGSLFATASSTVIDTSGPPSDPFSTRSLAETATKSAIQLKSGVLDDQLALQVVKNLFFVGKCFMARHAPSPAGTEEEDDQDGSEEEETEETEETRERERWVDADAEPARWLFGKLSYQARVAHNTRPSAWEDRPVREAQQTLSVCF